MDADLCSTCFCAENHKNGRSAGRNFSIRAGLQEGIRKKIRLLYRKCARVLVRSRRRGNVEGLCGYISRVRADTCPMYVQLQIPCLNRLLSGGDNLSAEVYTLS